MTKESVQRGSAEPGFLGWLARCLKPYPGRCLVVLLAILTQVTFRVAVPLGYQTIFDEAIAEGQVSLLIEVLTWLMIGWLLHGLSGLAQDHASAWIGSRSMNDLRERMFLQLQRLSDAYYERVDSGDLMSRFSNDLAVIEEVLARGLYTALFSSINLLASLVLLFLVDWRLAALTLGLLVAAFLIPRLLSPRARDQAYERKRSEAEVAAAIQESIGAHSMVRAFDLRDYVLTHFRKLLASFADKTVAAYVSTALVGRTASQSVFFIQILIMGLGGWLAIEGALSIGALIGFAALLQNVSNASNHLAGITPELLRAAGGIGRVQEFLAEEPAEDPGLDLAPLPRLAREIVFDNVSFAYDDQSGPSLDGVTFRLRAGESIALVGPSGSGKSTVLNLLLRLHHPARGRILFDGVDIRQRSERSLRDQISVVLQETVLLKASFEENIRLGKLGASSAEIEEAARKANVHEVILDKPQGYATQVGEGGRHLSVGQRQRIAIARAILRDPAVLVLDEATSALDPAAEAAVHKTLVEVARGRTVVSATHHLTSVVECDHILVLEKGRLVEEGRHRDLMARRGAYHHLWRKQSGFEISRNGIEVEVAGKSLHQVPLLSTLDEEGLRSIAGHFSSQVVPRGRYVFRQGDVGDAFYLIAKGRMEVLVQSEGRERRRAVLETGDFFGELALLDAKPRNASVRALSSSLLVVVPRQPFERHFARHPGLRAALERTARGRRAAQEDLD
ncbi:MAG: ABC transporter transmembrane domain-containing protein [Acidobacteriota bacterium]